MSHITRRQALFTLPGALAAQTPSARRPNFVFVLTDDQRWDSLGCTGSPHAKTPHIDRLAKEGVILRNYFCVTPLCSPSRASYLTGLYAHTHRIINNDKQGLSDISHSLLTFPRILRENGYETAFIGKWHMGFDDTRRPGFDHWISFRGQGQYIDGVVNENDRRRQLTGYMTDYLNAEAVKFVEQKHSKPFALCLHHKAVHFPYLPAPRHQDLFHNATFVDPPSAKDDLSGKPVLTRTVERQDPLLLEGSTPEPAESRRGRPRTPDAIYKDQMRCLAAVDEGVGMLRAALEKTGQLEDTVFIFTSDNGYLMGEHGQYDQKRLAYEESIRLPMVIRYPRLASMRGDRNQITLNIDIAPTILDIAGVKPYERMHGQSMLPILRNANAPGRISALFEYFNEKNGLRYPRWIAVRTERWKLIRYQGVAGIDELYDLSTDAIETKNRIDDPALASQVSELDRELRKLLDASR